MTCKHSFPFRLRRVCEPRAAAPAGRQAGLLSPLSRSNAAPHPARIPPARIPPASRGHGRAALGRSVRGPGRAPGSLVPAPRRQRRAALPQRVGSGDPGRPRRCQSHRGRAGLRPGGAGTAGRGAPRIPQGAPRRGSFPVPRGSFPPLSLKLVPGCRPLGSGEFGAPGAPPQPPRARVCPWRPARDGSFRRDGAGRFCSSSEDQAETSGSP